MKHNVEEIELKNGARGLLIDVPNASVMTTKVLFRGGMRYAKSPEVYEIAHVVEHLSFGANSVYKMKKITKLSSPKTAPITMLGHQIFQFAMKPNVLILNGIAFLI